MTFKASLDNTAKAITIGVTILFAAIVFGEYIIIKDSTGRSTPVYTTVAVLLIYFTAFAFRPINYKILQEKLIINRLVFPVKIDRSEIKTVEVLTKEQIGISIRTFGVGGLFGYYGSFSSFALGSMTWYATRRDKVVLITTTKNKKIMVTPNEAEAFVAELRR